LILPIANAAHTTDTSLRTFLIPWDAPAPVSIQDVKGNCERARKGSIEGMIDAYPSTYMPNSLCPPRWGNIAVYIEKKDDLMSASGVETKNIERSGFEPNSVPNPLFSHSLQLEIRNDG